MKVIIEHDGVKRVIDGPFQMGLSVEDAKNIIRCLEENAGQGWVNIVDMPPKKDANKEPIRWKEGAE